MSRCPREVGDRSSPLRLLWPVCSASFARYGVKGTLPASGFWRAHDDRSIQVRYPRQKVAQHSKQVVCCAANQCSEGAASSCIGEEATLNCNFTYKLLYIDVGNRQNYTRQCTPPFFFCKGVAPNGVTNGPIVIGLFCAQLWAVTYTPYQACNRRFERVASLFGK